MRVMPPAALMAAAANSLPPRRRAEIYPPYSCPTRQAFCHFTGPHKPWKQLPSEARASSGKFWGSCADHWHTTFNALDLAFPLVWTDKLDRLLEATRGAGGDAAAGAGGGGTAALEQVATALRPIRLRSGSLLRSLGVPLLSSGGPLGKDDTPGNLGLDLSPRLAAAAPTALRGAAAPRPTSGGRGGDDDANANGGEAVASPAPRRALLPWAVMEQPGAVATDAVMLGVRVDRSSGVVHHVSTLEAERGILS